MARELTSDMISEDVTELQTKNIPSRLEMIQKRRLKYMEKIEGKGDDWLADEGLSITYMQLLNGFEKQELYKHKSAQDKEEGDKDRKAYEQAAETFRLLRQQRRDDIANGNPIIDNPPAPPKYNENLAAQFGTDEIAARHEDYKEQDWKEFHKDIIRAGKDPRHMIDNDGNIVEVVDGE